MTLPTTLPVHIPGARSRSPKAAADLERAEESTSRQGDSGLTFWSVTAALGWYFEARERMHAPQGVAPRGEIGLDGKMHRISVDGGQGGDLDEVLSTLATIGQALDKLKAYAPRAHEVVVWVVRDGKSLSDLEQPTGLSAASVSRERDRGFAYLAGVWAGSGLLR
jgi:hypothetical protein